MSLIRILTGRIRKRIAFIFKKNKFLRPSRVVVELTNRCNLNCPFCLVGQQNDQKSVAHDDLQREFGYIELSLVKKIIRDAKAFGMNEILLTFQGESLLHKQVVDFVKLSKEKGLRSIIFTNGLLLSPEHSRRLVLAGLNEVRFSVDGASNETYQQNRVGGRFEEVYNNMKDMVRIAQEEGSNMHLIWQFIVLRNNEHEVEIAGKMARDIGIEFQPKTFAESAPELATQYSKYRRRWQPKPCKDLYRSMWVYWNGDVVPCCYDLTGKEILGNVNQNTLEEIWNGECYASFRKRIAEAVVQPISEPELCKHCLKWA